MKEIRRKNKIHKKGNIRKRMLRMLNKIRKKEYEEKNNKKKYDEGKIHIYKAI